MENVSPQKFVLELGLLRTGDILMTAADTKQSRLIQKKTDGDHSHVLLHVGGGSGIHADGKGVHAVNLQRMLFESPKHVRVLRAETATSHEIEIAVTFVRSQIGKEYSIPEAVRSRKRREINTDTTNLDRQFCSRLVAQAFDLSGLKLVPNPDYCYPQDLADSLLLEDVEGIVRPATLAEIMFCASDSPLEKQTEATNKILAAARKLFKKDLQTFEDVLSAVIKEPEHDAALSKIVRDSGYLDLWRYELAANPWRYQGELFQKIPLSPGEKIARAQEELTSARALSKQYEFMLATHRQLYETFKLIYLRQEVELYQTLVKNSARRAGAALFVLQGEQL
jgi:hypothetical protein